MNNYKSPDLYLSAYLKCKGFPIRLERKNNKCFFLFEGVSDKDIESFYNNDSLGVTDYKNALIDIKSMIHNRGV